MSDMGDGQAAGETTGSDGGNEGGLDPNLYPGIEDVPQEYRQYVDPILKDVNANANRHVSEANSKLEAWKPYEELGVNEIEKEDLEGLLGFYQMVANAQDDPTAFKAWWENVGNEFGFVGEDGEEEDDFGIGDEEGGFDKQSLMGEIEKMFDEKMSPFAERFQNQEMDEGLKQADQIMDGEFNAIKEQFPTLKLDEKLEANIATYALKYQDQPEGAIKQGFEDWKAMHDEAQGDLFAQVEGQPDRGEGPGTPNTNLAPVTNFKDAESVVKAALENAAKS